MHYVPWLAELLSTILAAGIDARCQSCVKFQQKVVQWISCNFQLTIAWFCCLSAVKRNVASKVISAVLNISSLSLLIRLHACTWAIQWKVSCRACDKRWQCWPAPVLCLNVIDLSHSTGQDEFNLDTRLPGSDAYRGKSVTTQWASMQCWLHNIEYLEYEKNKIITVKLYSVFKNNPKLATCAKSHALRWCLKVGWEDHSTWDPYAVSSKWTSIVRNQLYTRKSRRPRLSDRRNL